MENDGDGMEGGVGWGGEGEVWGEGGGSAGVGVRGVSGVLS